MRSPRLALLAAAVVVAGCADGEGPVGAPGGYGDLELRYVTPRLQVRPEGEPASIEPTLLVRRRGEDGETTPLAGAGLVVKREKGEGRLSVGRVTTDQDGRASVTLETSGRVDETRIVFEMEEDRRAYLPFEVVTAPVVPLALEPGEVRPDVVVPPAGALLRFELGPGDEAILVPYQTQDDRAGMAYRFLYQGDDPSRGAVAVGMAPPPTPSGRPAVVVEDRGHVRAGDVEPGRLEPAATVPASVSIQSCEVSVDRQAPLRYLGTRIALYVDAPPALHQARIDSLGIEFDERIHPRNTELFGPTPDQDGNGVVVVVMTPELGRKGGVYCDGLRTVGVEALFTSWDPQDPIALSLGILAHEHQHLVNAWHHLRTRGEIGDERWLNEAMSYAAEPLNGYWHGPLIRIWNFLSGQNGGLTMLPLEYGEAFNDKYMLFLLYLGDRFGPDFYRRLGTSGRAGVRNVEFVTGQPIDALLRDWFIASAVDGRGLTDDPRWSYGVVDLGGMEAEIAACDCLPKPRLEGMNLEPLFLDGRFDVSRAMDGFDADFYRLVVRPDAAPSNQDVFFDPYGRPTRLAIVRGR